MQYFWRCYYRTKVSLQRAIIKKMLVGCMLINNLGIFNFLLSSLNLYLLEIFWKFISTYRYYGFNHLNLKMPFFKTINSKRVIKKAVMMENFEDFIKLGTYGFELIFNKFQKPNIRYNILFPQDVKNFKSWKALPSKAY